MFCSNFYFASSGLLFTIGLTGVRYCTWTPVALLETLYEEGFLQTISVVWNNTGHWFDVNSLLSLSEMVTQSERTVSKDIVPFIYRELLLFIRNTLTGAWQMYSLSSSISYYIYLIRNIFVVLWQCMAAAFLILVRQLVYMSVLSWRLLVN